MNVAQAAGWIAPTATAIAAMMTAINLGARCTGFGFVVFTIGSIGWCVVGLTSDQNNLLLSNAFLTLVNLVGIWRWLGRQARYDEESQAAIDRSGAHSPDLFSATGIADIAVLIAGKKVGSGVEAMVDCRDSVLAYLVVRSGGLAGAGEKLTAVERRHLRFSAEAIHIDLAEAAFDALPEWKPSKGSR